MQHGWKWIHSLCLPVCQCANKIEGSMPNHKWPRPWIKARQFLSFCGQSANPSTSSLIYITSYGLTCCEMEKPIIMSPSGTSQDTVAESARRCMTDTLTGAGGRSGGNETGTEGPVNPPTSSHIILFMPSVFTPHLVSQHSEHTAGVCFF